MIDVRRCLLINTLVCVFSLLEGEMQPVAKHGSAASQVSDAMGISEEQHSQLRSYDEIH